MAQQQLNDVELSNYVPDETSVSDLLAASLKEFEEAASAASASTGE
jgi:hypothetical protein